MRLYLVGDSIKVRVSNPDVPLLYYRYDEGGECWPSHLFQIQSLSSSFRLSHPYVAESNQDAIRIAVSSVKLDHLTLEICLTDAIFICIVPLGQRKQEIQ